MSAALSKLLQMTLTYVVMPLFAKLIVSLTKHFQDKKEEKDRNARIQAAIKRFEEAKNEDDKKAAFRDLVRARD